MSFSVMPWTPSVLMCKCSLMFFDCSQLDLAVEDRLGRAGHPDRRVAAGPADAQQTAVRLDLDLLIEQALPDARDHRRTRAGAAGQRLAGTAFVNAQTDVG